MDLNERRALKLALFSISQLGEEKKFDIPFFLLGDVLYDHLLKGKDIIRYQEYTFPMLWQAFFDSILSDSYKRVLKNQAIVFLSVFISKNV